MLGVEQRDRITHYAGDHYRSMETRGSNFGTFQTDRNVADRNVAVTALFRWPLRQVSLCSSQRAHKGSDHTGMIAVVH